MTHAELHGQVAKFVHGADSHGDLLVPYQHDNCCPWCKRLTAFIEKILEDYNPAEGVWYPKDDFDVVRRRARFYLSLPKGTTMGEARKLWRGLS